MKNLILSAMFGLGFSMVGGCGMEPATEADVAESEEAVTVLGYCEIKNGVETGRCVKASVCIPAAGNVYCGHSVGGTHAPICGFTVDGRTCQ